MKYNIDNAGKIFPMTYTKEAPGCFKLCAYLYNEVNIDILQEAVYIALERFPNFNVTLKNGLFWHYYKTNLNKPKVEKETEIPFLLIEPFSKGSFPFQVLYNEKKICVEFYHALTDANGGMEFLKAICYHYLILNKVELVNNDTILTNEIEFDSTEHRDSFNDNYNKKAIKYEKDPSCLKLKGEKTNTEIVNVLVNVEKLKVLAKKENFTITEYIGGTIIYSIYKNVDNIDKLPISLLVPVNARKYYNSKSLKNFILYIRSPFFIKDEVTLKDTRECVKNTLRNDLSKDYLDSLIKSNVSIQKNFFLNFSLLFIKKRLMKFGYKKVAGGKTSITFSNVQDVKTPELMKDYIDTFEFSISPSNSLPIAFSGVSYNNKLRLSFNTNIKEREIINHFISILEEENLIYKTE